MIRHWLTATLALALAATLAATVAGCTRTQPKAAADHTTNPPAATTTGPGPLAMRSLVTMLTDHGFTVGTQTATDTGTGLIAREAVETSIDGSHAYLYTFANTESAQTWARMAADTGAVAAVGDRWAVNPVEDDQTINSTLAEQIVAALGGRVL